MSLIFTKTNQTRTVIMLLVTAVHVAIILFGLFSLNARSEHGAQIMMMASLIDHDSSNITKKISNKTASKMVSNSVSNTASALPKTAFSQKDQYHHLEERSDSEVRDRPSENTEVGEVGRVDEVGVSPVTMPNPFAKGLDNPKPPYPLMSRRLNEEGKVVLNVCVSLTGLVERLKLEKTSGYQRLDDIALETVKKWKFIPAKNQDKNMNACYLLPVQFILRKERSKLNS